MKAISEMTMGELAAYIDTHLRQHGIDVVLSGGASVAIYSQHKYVSKDLDFIAQFTIDRKKVETELTLPVIANQILDVYKKMV